MVRSPRVAQLYADMLSSYLSGSCSRRAELSVRHRATARPTKLPMKTIPR